MGIPYLSPEKSVCRSRSNSYHHLGSPTERKKMNNNNKILQDATDVTQIDNMLIKCKKIWWFHGMCWVFSLCPSDLYPSLCALNPPDLLHPSPYALCTWKLTLISMESQQTSLASWFLLGFGQWAASGGCRVKEVKVFIPLVPALMDHTWLLAAFITSFRLSFFLHLKKSESECCSVRVWLFGTPWIIQPHGILQARILEWVAFPFSRGSFQPRDQTQVSCIAGGFLTSWATREALPIASQSVQSLSHVWLFAAPWTVAC